MQMVDGDNVGGLLGIWVGALNKKLPLMAKNDEQANVGPMDYNFD